MNEAWEAQEKAWKEANAAASRAQLLLGEWAERYSEYKAATSATDPKLSDSGVRRGTCMVGGKVAVAAGAVTHGAVRCSAWLGVAFWVATPEVWTPKP